MSDFSAKFDSLPPLSKRFLVKVISLAASKEGLCYASDKFFMEELRATRSSLRATISDCLNKGFLSSITAFGVRSFKFNKKTSTFRVLIPHCSLPAGSEIISNMEGVVSGLEQFYPLPPSDCSNVENLDAFKLAIQKIKEEPFVRDPFITTRGPFGVMFPSGNPNKNKGGRPKGSRTVKPPKTLPAVPVCVAEPVVQAPVVQTQVNSSEVVELLKELNKKVDGLGNKLSNMEKELVQIDRKIINLDITANATNRNLDYRVEKFVTITNDISSKVNTLGRIIMDTDPDVEGPTHYDTEDWIAAWRAAKLKAKQEAGISHGGTTHPLALTGLDTTKVAVEPVEEAASDLDQVSYSDPSSYDEFDPEWEYQTATEPLQYEYSDPSSEDEIDPEFNYCSGLEDWQNYVMGPLKTEENQEEPEEERGLIEFDESAYLCSAEAYELSVNYDCDVQDWNLVLPPESVAMKAEDWKTVTDDLFNVSDEEFKELDLKPIYLIPEPFGETNKTEETENKTLDISTKQGYNPGRLFDDIDEDPEDKLLNREITKEIYDMEREENLTNGWRRIWGDLQLLPGQNIEDHWIAKNCEINKMQEYDQVAKEEVLGRAYMKDGAVVVPMYLLGVYKVEVKIEDAYPEDVANFVKENLT